ncbi:nucleolar protein 14 [Eublepharis macularius]|uniref:Nucleolar protein 14 n=1 Tax=Eublepharis macularius TaxID=481883 RepID=A0AA97KIE7_EUBMA|nr:nucleolar protein 14 [Eublepharis macularius]
MGKVGPRKGGGSAVARPARSNPFEVKVNRQKFHILGRKTKHDVGRPGVSRSKAHKKRTLTLLKEYKEKDKSSVFKDKRIGEYDSKISSEEKMMKRFALEQQKTHEKRSIYNLNEEEDLTHYGQSLADIEQLKDVPESDSDTEETGMLSAELTAAHFGGGGGLLHKKALSGQENEEDKKPKSRKELIEELIAKSKQEKRERQTQRENTLELTEKLDSDWKEIQGFLSHKTPKSERNHAVEEKLKADEYDMLVRELGFEMKARPSGRMKTEEELAKEEQARLLQLEADRLRRMRGEEESDTRKKSKHISADDLADGFILDKNDRRLLSYNDGKLNIENDEDEGVEESTGINEDDVEEEGTEEDSSSEADAVDNHSDLESDDGSMDETSAGEAQKKRGKGDKNKLKEQNAKRKAASLELPYTFAAPESYQQLKVLLLGRTMEEQLLVIERIRKSNHPSLAVENKAKLEKLFGFLLEYIGELAAREPPELKTVDKLIPTLYDLCQMFPEAVGNHVKLILRDVAHDMEEILEVRGRAPFPELDMLIYLKIIAILFPTSDYWHPVVTPSMVYMSQLLTKCPVTTLQDVVKGLFVCCLFLQYVSLSQRFIPELVNFLLRILYMAIPSREVQGRFTSMRPLKSLDKNFNLLVVSEIADAKTWQRQNLPLHTVTGSKEDRKGNHLRLSCIGLCLDLVKRCAVLYGSLPSFWEIMKPIQILCKHMPVSEYPAQLQELHNCVLTQLEAQVQHYHPLVCEKKKPVPLKLFTPKIVKVLEFGRKQETNEREQERKRLIHRHKRELKGAIREIRKDNQFLARTQLTEIMERDSERKRKVKRLFGSLAEQEGNWKAMKKKKF